MLADSASRPVESCIQYGNLDDQRTTAQFSGTQSDEQATNSNIEKSCKMNAKSIEKSELEKITIPKDGWTDTVHTFFPSDLKQSSDTMLVLDGEISVTPTEAGYVSSFVYDIQRYKDRSKGDPNGILIRPVFPIQQEFFLSALEKDNNLSKDNLTMKLDSKGKVSFSVPKRSDLWTVSAGYYEFLDRNLDVVGVVRIPLFAPI
jgi:hypothetical protein